MAAEVTVLPVPGGPWISDSGLCNALRTAVVCEAFKPGREGAVQSLGMTALTVCSCTSCPSSLRTRKLLVSKKAYAAAEASREGAVQFSCITARTVCFRTLCPISLH